MFLWNVSQKILVSCFFLKSIEVGKNIKLDCNIYRVDLLINFLIRNQILRKKYNIEKIQSGTLSFFNLKKNYYIKTRPFTINTNPQMELNKLSNRNYLKHN